ncbi:unnamed protein product [Moneuplotes crassus]|uniref:Uncharacterized protein n=1 Tax=Euplotes crassus TaxID=5936 RepID=A0AAD1XUI0_EUPCR|nr:unnamed protein product [Moneuplotes crassus]
MEDLPTKREQDIFEQEKIIEQSVYETSCKIVGKVLNSNAKNCRLYGQIVPGESSYFLVKKMKPIGLRVANLVSVSQSRNWKGFRKMLRFKFIKQFLCFTVKPKSENKHKYAFYHKFVIQMIPRVTVRLKLMNCQISSQQFKKIIYAGRSLKKMEFWRCKMDLKLLKLTENAYYSIEYVRFYMEHYDSSDYENELQDCIEPFLRAASLTNLRKSLEKVQLPTPLKLNERIKEIITTLQFENLRI